MTTEKRKLFNDLVNTLENHRDITINHCGRVIKTTFREYIECTQDSAVFILDCANDNQQFQLRCDFLNGRLYDLSAGDEIIVEDVFSARYLRGMLFAGQEALLRLSDGYDGSLTEEIHKRNESKTNVKVPVFVSETKGYYLKRWLYVGNVSLSKGYIRMEGLMSSHSTSLVASIPVKASCKVRLSDELVEWTYMQEGEKLRIKDYEFFHLPESALSIKQILFAYTEYSISMGRDTDGAYPELTRSIRAICNGESFYMMPKRADHLGMYSPEEILFRDIESITPSEVVARVCSSSSLENELVYERSTGKLYFCGRTGARKKKVEINVQNDPRINEGIKNALSLIEEYMS